MSAVKIVLDLDGTLVDSVECKLGDCKSCQHPCANCDHHIVCAYHVYLRPGAVEFVRRLQKSFTVGVWTASGRLYAEGICNLLFVDQEPACFLTSDDCTKSFKHASFGGEAWSWGGGCITLKPLRKLKSRLGWSLDHILIVDDTPSTWAQNYGNAVPIPTWSHDDEDDCTLRSLANYLERNWRDLPEDGTVRRTEKRWWLGG